MGDTQKKVQPASPAWVNQSVADGAEKALDTAIDATGKVALGTLSIVGSVLLGFGRCAKAKAEAMQKAQQERQAQVEQQVEVKTETTLKN